MKILKVCFMLLVFSLVQVIMPLYSVAKDSDSNSELLFSFEDESELSKLDSENVYMKRSNQYAHATDGLTSLMATFKKSDKAFIKYDFEKDSQDFEAEKYNEISFDCFNNANYAFSILFSIKVKTDGKISEIKETLELPAQAAATPKLIFNDDVMKAKGKIVEFCIASENIEKNTLLYIDNVRIK